MFAKRVVALAALAAFPFFTADAVLAGGCGPQRSECYERVRTPDVYATVARPVVERPGYWTTHRSPATYGTIRRRVQVAPARAYHTYSEPIYTTVARQVVVAPGGYRWERTVDRHGRERICKVAVPAQTRIVHERVLVEPGRRVTHVVPAVYRDVARTVVLREAQSHRVYHEPVIGVRHRQVLVRRGGTHWQRSW